MAETKSTTVASKAYDPTEIEPKWYRYWEANGFFRTERQPGKKPHVIMMPPPNVTGRLHMGHALQDTIQDALTRLRRMQGYEALWMPGMDHAGIATQNVVERTLKRDEGLTRHDLGRERFVERVWDWVDEYGGIILQQKRQLGDSCDWDRERFTLDERYERAVMEVFVKLYEDGLIYRGHYLVNWDPENGTAISDEEVDNVERDGHLWYVKYPLADPESVRTRHVVSPQEGIAGMDEPSDAYITIATTRPETMLGDTAIAVHPEDERYRDLIGKSVILPLLEREIPIIADDYVKMEFGAGALKITPAHDKNDFEIGQRHGLEVINIMNPDATINEQGGPYEGLDRFEARKRIVADLEAQGLLVKVEDYKVNVPISSRSKEVIEPLISRQWFVKMKPLAEPAIEAVKNGTITFYPERWANEYFRWMENIRDWTISRQLWWGHRIPVWYYTDENGEVDESRDFVVSVDQPEPGMVQDEDVLDTWFSSWLWPFATLGWPDTDDEEVRQDLAYFYPTDVLVSGYDILFFWIARMIMAGLYVTGEVPYRDIFITGMIKDKLGRWMSKSLGNGIDPLEMIEQYGADAVRFSLTVLCAQGQDIKLDPTKFEMGRNFANKIWNAFNVFGQFMETDAEGQPTKDYRRQRSFGELELVERWMLTRLNETIAAVEEDITRYRLNEALTKIYQLFWGDYCDWYLELIKPPKGEAMDEDTIALAVELYETMIQLLHPFMPFITEELWWRLRPRAEGEACIASTWPTQKNEISRDDEMMFNLVQSIISDIRNIRNQYNVAPTREIEVRISLNEMSFMLSLSAHSSEEDDQEAIAEARHKLDSYYYPSFKHYIAKLAHVKSPEIDRDIEKPKASAVAVIGPHQVFVPLAGMIDLGQERERLAKEIEQKERFLTGVQKKLSNPQFINKAPAEVVERERQKQRDATAELKRLRTNLEELADA